MSRFKQSKYKNAYSYVYKKESWINDLNVGGNLNSYGQHIAASGDYVAFINDSTSQGGVAVLPLDSSGRFSRFPFVSGHSGFVTDFTFSPFHSRLLATGAEDCFVRLWELPEGGFEESISSPTVSLPRLSARVEALHFHPAADGVLASAAGTAVAVWDIEHQAEKYSLGGHEDTVQHFSWSGDGARLVSLCKNGKEKKLRIFDPRTGGDCTSETGAHNGRKDSCVLWLGDTNYILTSGFDMMRSAEVALWDAQNLSKPVTVQKLSTTTGSPMLFYDEDTKMVYVALKGESNIMFYELTEKSPFLSPGPFIHHGAQYHKGLCMVPKAACNVMVGQVARFLQLSQSAVVPIGYHIQRKSYTEFHADLFPDTAGSDPAMAAQEWFDGGNKKVAKVSLNPADYKKPMEKPATKPAKQVFVTSTPSNGTPRKTAGSPKPKQPPSSSSSSSSSSNEPPERNSFSPPSGKAPLQLVRSSKFRHVEGGAMHRSTVIDKLPKLNSTIPGDSDAFQSNRECVAAALATAGGQIGVFELNKPGRLDTDAVPTLQNVASVMDFTFDPFNNRRLVVACDDARIKVWDIPAGGLTDTLTEPAFCLIGHQDKPNVLAFHPQASSLMASSGYDGRLFIWSLDSQKVEIKLDSLPEALFAMAWSQDGCRLATIAKDHVIRIYEPRSSPSPVLEGAGPTGSRGARIVWLDDAHLVVSGFNRTSMRTLSLYSVEDLAKPMETMETNVSPATLIPYFDPDTKLLYLSGKGDRTVLIYEYVPTEAPYLFAVAPFTSASAHQGVSYLPKDLCDVKKVEIARGVRLCKTSIELFFVKVPRAKPQYFQDDLYSDTRRVWEPALTGREWLAGTNALQPCISLKPQGMKLLSEAPKEAPAAKKFASYNPNIKTDEEKKEELLSAMVDRMGDKDEEPLPQKDMDGCDSDEWSD